VAIKIISPYRTKYINLYLFSDEWKSDKLNQKKFFLIIFIRKIFSTFFLLVAPELKNKLNKFRG